MELIWTDFALASLEDIMLYIMSNFNETVALRVTREITAKTMRLKLYPLLGRRIIYIEGKGDLRCLNIRHNKVYYLLGNGTIDILLVWDSRRSPELLSSILNRYFEAL